MSSLIDAARRVQRGDVSAFHEIVEATSARLVRLCARIMGSVTEAEDVVQESYVKAYRAMRDGRFDERARVETWLHRIVVNTSVDARRKRRREPTGTLDDDRAGAIDGNAEATVALRELAALLDALPDDQRIALVLKSVEGMSSAEIAEVVGCSEGAVEQRLVRARAALKQTRSS